MNNTWRNERGLLFLLSCLAVCCAFFSPLAHARRPSETTTPPQKTPGAIGKAILAEKPTDVLGGRLTVRLPEGSRIEARPVPIMAAPESEEHETRVIFDAGKVRLVLLVNESFALASDDFEQDVKDWVAKWPGKYKVDALPLPAKGLKAVAVVPVTDPDHNRSDDSTFVEGLFVQSDDRTIQSLDVLVNAAGEKDLAGCKSVARQILRSVAPGTKKLRLAAGERRLFAFSKDVEISVAVPKNTVATKQDGPDFLVHRLIVLGRLASNSGSILIYLGGAPDYHAGAKKGDGMLFGKKVEWHSLTEGEGLQTLCPLAIPSDEHLSAHIIISAPNDAGLKVVKEAAESMKLVKAGGPLPQK
jgi:hypothetical protein